MMPIKNAIHRLAISACLVGIGLLAISSAMAATTARIGFSSKTSGFNAINARIAGTSEYALIEFIAADGSINPNVAITVTTSNAALMKVSKLPIANALGNYALSVPMNAGNGLATITATANVNGTLYTRTRDFSITPAAIPVPLPVGSTSTTINRALTPTLAADQSGCSTINYFDVGPGQTYVALGQLPWSMLKGCDTVRIHAKPNGGAYNEMMLISAGTNLAPTAPDKFMRVVGVLDPVTGARPIIDGTNATQVETIAGSAPRSLRYHDNPNPSRALYKLGLVMVGPQQGYDYNNGPAGYISIENLDIQNSVYNASFTDALLGQQGAYAAFGSCLYVEAAAHLVVKNNLMHNCGNGLFINSKNGAVVELSQDVLIEGNAFYNNSNAPQAGVSNGFSEHNSYTEARDIIFQYNYFGDVRPGAFGDCLKDRSSGLVVRYNTFASTCGLQMNLMDSTGGGSLIWGDHGYANVFVYGNLFDLSAPNASVSLLNFGGDSGTVANYRQGVFHFYNNTMFVKGDATHGSYPEVFLFNLNVPSAVAEVTNNVFQTSPSTSGAPGKIQTIAFGKGTVNLQNNWVSPNAAPYWLGHLSGAVVNGWNTNLGASNQPLFVNAATHDFRLSPASPLINAGGALTTINLNMLPVSEPVTQHGVIPTRKQDGAIDIGAFEF